VSNSCVPGFHKLSVAERVHLARDRGLLSPKDSKTLLNGGHLLTLSNADAMIENVVGVMGLPVGLGLNFLINSKDYVVPMAVEEPSIVAAVSFAAKTARSAGGFQSESTDPILIGQIQVMDISHPSRARSKLLQRKEEVLNLANSLHPRLVARGGGARDLEVYQHSAGSESSGMFVVHLLVDTCDAMGANLVNTMCEGVASLVEGITGGKVFLRILSNLTDRALVRARMRIPAEGLTSNGFDGEQVRDGIIIAGDFAEIDPYRAATHNKGIMNGIDAVALATGNDWRAVEAGAHAYAARGSHYTSLTRWYKDDEGCLIGEIEIPLKVGIVGGSLESNPTGHMTLHARSIVTAAGAPPELFDTVVERVVESGEVKVWNAKELLKQVQTEAAATPRSDMACGHGKIILFGEHAVVYGSRAIAAPVPLAVHARVVDHDDGVWLVMPRWGVEKRLRQDPKKRSSIEETGALILDKLGLGERSMRIEVYSQIPRAMGLGGSSAVAVAIIRALDGHYELGLPDDEINRLAFRAEQVFHGTPSGIDNTVATYGHPILYRAGSPPEIEELHFPKPLNFVIGITGNESLTAKTVARVRTLREKNPAVIDKLFKAIDVLTGQALVAIRRYDMERLGDLMNVCHGLLNSLQVSSWELEELIQIARENGALGAKLTGGGGGGSMIALCPDNAEQVIRAMNDSGYQAMEVSIA